MATFPKIETERLFLNELKAQDIPDIVKYASNKNISEFTQNVPFPYSEKDAVFWINMAREGFKKGTNLIFAIRHKPENQFIGGIGLSIETKSNRAEIGYWIAEPFWNKGYITEASKAVIKYSFKVLKLQKVTSSHFNSNPASGRVMRKNGMKKEGELEKHILKNNVYHDLILYGLTKEQFHAKEA
ncbi:GNAT family N-acetyltransferase [Cochleicola gelatinilyticus]|uniref:GNAT family acetyltransferase n=1 Tax=Cochleicola gelatinilyticus TaxID=1763537 RepID=A0A167JA01_9FLAO|nr:GNAT family protein [Cochleicola gelatinilyticus]OAB80473.1 GNAT family acetyltransferase [Cochleicola gelatinilyticus]